jgi:DNA-binding beta-propeller fold protein YncE
VAAVAQTPEQRPDDAPAVTLTQVLAIVPGPTAVDGFRRPTALCVDVHRGILVVADTGHQRLATFDISGRSRGTIPYSEGRPLESDVAPARILPAEPGAIAIDARGRLYVVDNLGRTVEVLTARGSHLGWIQPASEAIQSGRAVMEALAIGPSGRIYLLCSGELPGLIVLDSKGAILNTAGFEAEPPRLLRTPVSIAVDADERSLVVVDPKAEEVVLVLDVDGTVRTRFGRHGEGEGTFSLAVHAAWGPQGTLWVTDTVRHSISVFDSVGSALGRIGGRGVGPGQFEYPVGCAFVSGNRLIVLERSSARFQLLEVEMAVSRHQPAGPSRQAGGPLPSPFPADRRG